MKTSKLVALLCLCAGVAAAGTAHARELKLAVGLAPSHAIYWGLEQFAKAVKEKSGGELDVKVYSLALLSTGQMLNGVRDGAVDMGFLLPQQFPSELPEQQLPIDLAMLGKNSYAMAGAMSEYIFGCPECLAELQKYNQVFLGASSTPEYSILSTKKVATMDELKGKKLRSGAPPWARWAQPFGVVALTIPGNNVFEAMSAGTIDGAIMATTELTSIRLMDVVKHITLGVPNGTYHGQDINNMNRNTWRSLTEAQRRMILDLSAMSSAAATWKMASDAKRDLADAKQKGIQVYDAPADVVARTKTFVADDLANVAQNAEKAYGIKNAAQKVDRFRQLVDKWEKLTPASRNWTIEELADVYRREIFSKIDAKTYGM